MAQGSMARERCTGTAANPWLGLAGWVALCLAAGVIGAAWTGSAVPTWYEALRKPSWTPPSFLFGPVWTVLYVLMGCAAWRIWKACGFAGAPVALGTFLAQLALNTLWSGLFFGLRNPGLAFGEVLLLWCAILATLLLFARLDRKAGWLIAPYLAWVTFAAALNGAVWVMNQI